MKRPTLSHVSEIAGVSVQTVSHILNANSDKKYRQETRDKVLKAAKQIRYKPNATARSMVNQETRIVGVAIPMVSRSWFSGLDACESLMGVHMRMAEDGYVVTVIFLPGDAKKEEVQSRIFSEHVLDGLIVMGFDLEHMIPEFKNSASHCIWCDTNVRETESCIRRNEKKAGEMVALEMIRAGYNRLFWVGYEVHSSHYSHSDRLEGVCKVADQYGIEVMQIGCQKPYLDPKHQQIVFKELTPQTGIITEHHHFSWLVSDAARKLGICSGLDFGLASCDISKERLIEWPSLSGAVIDRYHIGEVAAEMLLSAIKNPDAPLPSTVIEPVWHAGDTIRKVGDL